MERGIRKCPTFVIRQFPENMTQAIISKRLKFPKDDQTDTNFIAPHRMYFYRSESILDSLKSVFNVYSRKLLLNSFGSPSRKCGNLKKCCFGLLLANVS